jgi:succinylglutamate desuccinylase
MEILIVGGLHGDEPHARKIAEHFIENNIKGINGLIANPEAVKQQKRYLETDMNRSFASPLPLSLEEKAAQALKPKLNKYDLIIDIHNTKASGTTMGIVTNPPNSLQQQVANIIGFNKLIQMPPSGSLIAENTEKSISIEIAESDVEKEGFTVDDLIEKIKKLPEKIGNSNKREANLDTYRFIKKVTKPVAKRLNIKLDPAKNFKLITDKSINPNSSDYFYTFIGNEGLGDLAFIVVEKTN